MKTHVNLTIDEQILNWIDSLRGQEPRSKFINKILLKVSREAKSIFEWDAEDQKAENDIKHGRVHSFSDAGEAIKWLKKK